MAKTKPITPYQRLLDDFREYARKVNFPRRVEMFILPKEKMAQGWSMNDVWERTMAAGQLGYDVVAKADNDGLHFVYVSKRPDKPWNV